LDESTVTAQYTIGGLGQRILDALVAEGKSINPLDPDDLLHVEEFHALGRKASAGLAVVAGVGESDRVLDVGCGIGGPCRFLARQTGCRVVGVDLTEEFCGVAEDLNRRTGLADRVSIQQADALHLPFPAASFDVVWTQHVSMNIEDKPALYAEFRRVVKPGGRLAFFDVVAGAGSPVYFPVPWADEPSLSFLASAGETRELVEKAGFSVEHWDDLSLEALEFFRQFAASTSAPASNVGPQLLIRNLRPKVANFIRNLEKKSITMLRGVGSAI
jgi:SAM-dependent methyltransferase